MTLWTSTVISGLFRIVTFERHRPTWEGSIIHNKVLGESANPYFLHVVIYEILIHSTEAAMSAEIVEFLDGGRSEEHTSELQSR